MAIFPNGVSTDSDLYVAVNNKATVLSDNPLSNSATTVNVASTTGFPTNGIITIDFEAIKYTGVTATSFTGCTRGYDGTTAVSHVLNSGVYHDIPAAHHNVIKDEVKAIEQSLSDRFGLGSAISKRIIIGTDAITGFSGTPTTGGTLAANTYYYKLFALNANGYIGVPSEELTVVVGGPNNKVDFTWSAVPEAVSYRLMRGTLQGSGDGYFNATGTSFSDSGQAFDASGSAVLAVNQFKVELPGSLDLTASQGAVRWHDYVDNVITGSIACTSAGEMEFVTTQGIVSGMFLFSKYGTASPFNIDLRSATPRINFNAADGDIACGGVVGVYVTPTLVDVPTKLKAKGTATNDSAAAGYIGEYVESVISTLTSFPASSGNIGDATSISLTAGDWDVSLCLLINESGGSLTTQVDVGISTTSGNDATGLVLGSNRLRVADATTLGANSAFVPSYRMSLSSTTTVYAKLLGSFTVSTPQYRCRLSARRVR